MNPDWFVTLQDIQELELVEDGNYALSWGHARNIGSACKRHPAKDRHGKSCDNERCLTCHRYREETPERRRARTGGWVWTDEEAVRHLNAALAKIQKFTMAEPLWLAKHGASPKSVKENMGRTLDLLGQIRLIDVRAWKDLTHMGMATWPVKELYCQRLTEDVTVKVGVRPGNGDEEHRYYFMVGQDPGNKLYERLFSQISPSSLNREKTADILEGLLGLYHGLKRLRSDKRMAVTRALGNIYHLAGLWLRYVNKASDWYCDPGFDHMLKDAPHGLPDQWFGRLSVYDEMDNYRPENPDDEDEGQSKATRSNTDSSEEEAERIQRHTEEGVQLFEKVKRAESLENAIRTLQCNLSTAEDTIIGDASGLIGHLQDARLQATEVQDEARDWPNTVRDKMQEMNCTAEEAVAAIVKATHRTRKVNLRRRRQIRGNSNSPTSTDHDMPWETKKESRDKDCNTHGKRPRDDDDGDKTKGVTFSDDAKKHDGKTDAQPGQTADRRYWGAWTPAQQWKTEGRAEQSRTRSGRPRPQGWCWTTLTDEPRNLEAFFDVTRRQAQTTIRDRDWTGAVAFVKDQPTIAAKLSEYIYTWTDTPPIVPGYAQEDFSLFWGWMPLQTFTDFLKNATRVMKETKVLDIVNKYGGKTLALAIICDAADHKEGKPFWHPYYGKRDYQRDEWTGQVWVRSRLPRPFLRTNAPWGIRYSYSDSFGY